MEIEKHWRKEHKLKAQNTIHDLILLHSSFGSPFTVEN